MSRVTHCVPIEAVRQGATIDGAVTLARLAEQRAEFEPSAIVELFEGGWIATLIYRRPGHPNRIHHAHVSLEWAPCESVRAGGARA